MTAKKIKRIYRRENVLEAALARIRWLFDEFPEVCVSWSGGKDSTVCLNLALQVAEERGRLPLKVMWVDQEAEWNAVVEFARETFADPRIEPFWLQVPLKMFNATSVEQDWLYCWEPGEQWMRPKEPGSIHENAYGTERFAELLKKFYQHHFDRPVADIAGVRCEESPSRFVGLTSMETYGGETWGKVIDRKRKQFTFYPLYDWSYRDIWKAIHEHDWPYCRIYDLQYQHGVPLTQMRVSNLHHETAVNALYYLQETERETWEALQRRLKGVHTAGQLQKSGAAVQKLPWMFESWREYRDYLLEHLTGDEARPKLRAQFEKNDREFAILRPRLRDKLHRCEVASILANDYHLTKIQNLLHASGSVFLALRRHRRGAYAADKYEELLRKSVQQGDLEAARIRPEVPERAEGLV